MKLILSDHAKKRMVERKVSLRNVKDTLELPDYTISKSGKKEAYKQISNRVLRIIYIEKDKYLKVITLMWR